MVAGTTDGELAASESLHGRMLQAVPPLLNWGAAGSTQQPGESFSDVYYLHPVCLTTLMPALLHILKCFAKVVPAAQQLG